MLSSKAQLTDPPMPATQCPLCGQDNQCAVAAGTEPSSCWCMSATLDSKAKQQAANIAGPRRCICVGCGRPAERE